MALRSAAVSPKQAAANAKRTRQENLLATSLALKAAKADITADSIGLGNVDNTSDATKNAAAATLTNKIIDGGPF